MATLINGWWCAPDAYLTEEHRTANAHMFFRYFVAAGWTRKAIAAALGNIEVESSINPGIWQGLTPPPPDTKGYGLTQWTPYTKYSDWYGTGWENNGEGECERIQYEMLNELQWGNDVDISFWNFAHDNTQTLERLVLAWLWDYERPSNPDIPARQANALEWYNSLRTVPIWMLFKIANKRR